MTDLDGRCNSLLTPGSRVEVGIFKITFFTNEYFTKRGILSFYPFVEVSIPGIRTGRPRRRLTFAPIPGGADPVRGQVGRRALPVSIAALRPRESLCADARLLPQHSVPSVPLLVHDLPRLLRLAARVVALICPVCGGASLSYVCLLICSGFL